MRMTPNPETAISAMVARLSVIARPVRQGLWGMGVVALALSISAAISIGAVPIPLGTVWGVILDRLWPGLVTPDWTAGRAAIIWDIRLPRPLLEALVGAGLALAGAVFLVWADIVARTIKRPENLPIGIVTGLVGGLFFVWLLRRRRMAA